MERRLNKVIENYVTTFKDNIKTKLTELKFADNEKSAELLEFVFDYDRLCLSQEDFVKRKRIKNSIPSYPKMPRLHWVQSMMIMSIHFGVQILNELYYPLIHLNRVYNLYLRRQTLCSLLNQSSNLYQEIFVWELY